MLTKAYTGLETTGCGADAATGGSSSACTLVVSYDRLANGNDGSEPPGPHGSVDVAFTMRMAVTAV